MNKKPRTLTRQVKVRFNEAHHAMLRRMAVELERPLGEIVRDAVLIYAEETGFRHRGPSDAGQDVS